MKPIFLLVPIIGSCISCSRQTNSEANRTMSSTTISDVQLFMSKVHSGSFLAWELYLWRTIEFDNGRDGTLTYLTSVGNDPTSLSVRCKKLDSGVVYVVIDELNSSFVVEPSSQVSKYIRESEYEHVDSNEIVLRVVDKYGIEVNDRQFPLLAR